MQNKCLKTGTASFWRTSVLVYLYFLVCHKRKLNLLRALSSMAGGFNWLDKAHCLKFMVWNVAFCESARAPTRTPIKTWRHFLCIVYSYIFACVVLRSLKLPGATTFPNYNVMWLFVNCCSLLPLYFVCCCFVVFFLYDGHFFALLAHTLFCNESCYVWHPIVMAPFGSLSGILLPSWLACDNSCSVQNELINSNSSCDEYSVKLALDMNSFECM